MMGTALAGDLSTQPVSQIVLSDDAEVTLAAWHHGHRHTMPAHSRRPMGKGAGAA
jgi:hypothetical protein